MTSAAEIDRASDGVKRVARCALAARRRPWPYAEREEESIAAHWRRRTASSAALFNGTVYVCDRLALTSDTLEAELIAVEFRSFLHWRDHGFPVAGVIDAFGSALIRSAEGHILLGRQKPGHMNSGSSYLPSGLIDPRDVDAEGRIDIAASVMREVGEETGLGHGDLERTPGFLVTRCGAQLSIAIELQSRLDAGAIASRVRAHIAADANSELEDVILVDTPAALSGLYTPAFTGMLLDQALVRRA